MLLEKDLVFSQPLDTMPNKPPLCKCSGGNGVSKFTLVEKGENFYEQNAIKDPHRYAVQGSDTTMMPIAASLPGQ